MPGCILLRRLSYDTLELLAVLLFDGDGVESDKAADKGRVQRSGVASSGKRGEPTPTVICPKPVVKLSKITDFGDGRRIYTPGVPGSGSALGTDLARLGFGEGGDMISLPRLSCSDPGT